VIYLFVGDFFISTEIYARMYIQLVSFYAMWIFYTSNTIRFAIEPFSGEMHFSGFFSEENQYLKS
jgi:hypothetical protein